MSFTARRGKHAIHRHEHGIVGRPDGTPAIPHHRGGSLAVEGPSPEHPQGVWYHDPYERPEQPHHVHLAPCPANCDAEHEHVPVCTDHRSEACPAAHWKGGHPAPSHPHHVEFDGSTGQVGYTRLSREEIQDLAICFAFEEERVEREQEKVKARRDLIRAKAEHDPAFSALAEEFGIRLDR